MASSSSLAHSAPNPEPPFVATAQPSFAVFNSVQEIPPLPEPRMEDQIYAQWPNKERISGMPIVPEVQFVAAWTRDDGNCYWAAIATIIYGGEDYWPIVKAQHYNWFHRVLENPNHPRHVLYNMLNTDGVRSLSDLLHLPNSWTPTHIMQVTADLYELYLVMFNVPRDRPMEVTLCTRGCYNSRHTFIRFINNNHYEPMRPAYGRPSEFHFPEITIDNIANLKQRVRVKRQRAFDPLKVGVLRSDYAEGVPEQLLPKPYAYPPTEAVLRLMLGLDDSSGPVAPPKRNYDYMTTAEMRLVLKVEYKYKGYSKLQARRLQETLERLDNDAAAQSGTSGRGEEDERVRKGKAVDRNWHGAGGPSRNIPKPVEVISLVDDEDENSASGVVTKPVEVISLVDDKNKSSASGSVVTRPVEVISLVDDEDENSASGVVTKPVEVISLVDDEDKNSASGVVTEPVEIISLVDDKNKSSASGSVVTKPVEVISLVDDDDEEGGRAKKRKGKGHRSGSSTVATRSSDVKNFKERPNKRQKNNKKPGH